MRKSPKVSEIMESKSWLCLFWYILQIADFSSGWNLENHHHIQIESMPYWRKPQSRMITDVIQPETQKIIFNYYERMFIVFMNLEVLLYSTCMEYSYSKLTCTSLASLKLICWVTSSFQEHISFFPSTVSEAHHFLNLYMWLSPGGSFRPKYPTVCI